MDLLKYLRMINYEADKGGGGGSGDNPNPTDEDMDKGEEDTGGEPGKKDDEPKTFTQEQLDAIIADRLAREAKKREEAVAAAEAEAERKRLEEQGEYKALSDKRQEEIDRLQKLIDEQKASSLKAVKESLLVKAGYKDEQVELFTSLLEGETEDELQASLEKIVAASPPAKPYADPSVGNGRKQEPEKTSGHDKGMSAYERLKKLGKIKRK